MPGVTISSSYGAGGSLVAPLVARQLGLPLLDRAISSTVAEQMRVSLAEAEEAQYSRSRVDRFLSVLAPLSVGLLGTEVSPPVPAGFGEDVVPFRDQAEAIMRDALARGAVILGRAGAAAFRDDPTVLRVRLFGPPAERAAQATRIEGVDLQTAARRQPEVDEARRQYVRRLYGADIDDPRLYDLQVASTRVSPEACATAIAEAFRGLQSGGRSPVA